MNFFSDERAAEMRELFFESAAEQLQALNEGGLQLEQHPDDQEILRDVRRTVHTLKGDAAACGFKDLSELAHQLEDALTPEVAEQAGEALAEAVLIAADTFSSMLSAYRGKLQPPAGDELREQILSLTHKPGSKVSHKLQARFAWSEPEQRDIAEALKDGDAVYNIAMAVDPDCPMRSAAMQLVRNVLRDCGRVLAMAPDPSIPAQDLDVVEAAVITEHNQEWLERKCRIPAVISQIVVQAAATQVADHGDDVLDIVRHVTSTASDEEHDFLGQMAALTPPSPSAQSTKKAAPQQSLMENNGGLSAMAENLLRVDAERIDTVLDLVGELIIAKSMMHQAISEFDRRFPKDPLKTRFADAVAFQARIMNDLQKSVMKIRMVPVEHLFRRFPRVVRDVAKSCGKEVALVVTGQDTDLDKSILDMLAEPLAHLVRNSVDHGIESPSERIAAGKPAQGTVRLAAYHQGNQIVIEAGDDGRGIDRERLISKAVQNGMLTAVDAAGLSEQDALNLIFHPGLSTAAEVTAISGRGVGMDVVKSVLDRLKGHISIKTIPGKGTTFYLRVPLTLAIIKALLFRVADRMYAVPLASVVEIARTGQNEIHRVDNQDVIQLREDILPLVYLDHLAERNSLEKKFVVVVSLGERKFGLVVDRMVGEEELVIKALDDHLVATDLVSGASILGDGTVVLILNIANVVSRLGRLQVMMGATA
jgi:two-component system, chemotaxis family, sensor kinase CheA